MGKFFGEIACTHALLTNTWLHDPHLDGRSPPMVRFSLSQYSGIKKEKGWGDIQRQLALIAHSVNSGKFTWHLCVLECFLFLTEVWLMWLMYTVKIHVTGIQYSESQFLKVILYLWGWWWWLSCVWFFVIPWTVAHQTPLSMEFSRQEYWRGLPFSSPGELPDSGIKPESLVSPASAGGFFITVPPGKP